MHGFELMQAHLLLHQDEKRLCKSPAPRHMPDDRSFSHHQQRINNSRMVEQNWRGFEPEEWPMTGMQALSPIHSPYSANHALVFSSVRTLTGLGLGGPMGYVDR